MSEDGNLPRPCNANSSSSELCFFCSSKSLYACPQCNVQYCSSKCYKSSKHLKCSENFYKGLVEEQLKGSTASEESKRKMQEILHKVHQDNENEAEMLDSDDAEDLSERMKGIDLDDTDNVWKNLTQCEQREFLEMIDSGKTDELIPPWEAWWESNVVVSEVTDEASELVPGFVEICPPLVDCPPLSEIMKTEPSTCIAYNILNVLAAYVWTARIFNGDHQENCVDATESVLILSPVLSAGANYSAKDVAINTPKVEAQNHSWLAESDSFSSKVEGDVQTIVRGPNASFKAFYVSAALSDLHALFTTCKKALSSKKKAKCGVFETSLGANNQEIPKKFAKADLVKKCIKKIEFFLSYIKEYPLNVFNT